MDISRIDLNLLTTLEVLLAECNVTKAAARLNLSQPAVSAQLARLRDLFADPLFVPAHRGVMPTVRALELVEPLQAALNQLRNALQSTAGFDPATSRMTVTIACSDYIETVILAPLVPVLRAQAPNIRLAIRRLSPVAIGSELASGEADLVIAQPDPTFPLLHAERLFTDSYLLVGKKGHPALKSDLSVDDYVELEHVILSRRGAEFETSVDRMLATSGQRRNVVLSAASFLFLPEIVQQSDLVALIPRRLAARRADQLAMVDLSWLAETFDIDLIWGERSHSHPGHRWLRNLISQIARQPDACPTS